MVQKLLDERQTVQTLIRRHMLWRLIRVCTVYSGMSYRIFRVNTVIKYIKREIWMTNNCWMKCQKYTPWSDERSIWSGYTLFAHKIQIKICLSYIILRQSRPIGILIKLVQNTWGSPYDYFAMCLKLLGEYKTVWTLIRLIRRYVIWHLIWVCTVC